MRTTPKISNARRRHFLFGLITASLLLVAPSASFAEDRVPDQSITRWIKSAIANDPTVKTPDVSVSTHGGIVTLSGSVASIAAKKYALQEATKIRGVLGVIDQITVAPTSRFDADIALDVRRRIIDSDTVGTREMDITSKNGIVRLTGQVANWAEYKQAGLLASEVRGVTRVENDLWWRYTTKRGDQEIKDDALAALRRDVYTSELPIEVAVKGGVVTLSGRVGSAFEKERAGEDVLWLVAVKRENNDVKIEPLSNRGVRRQIVPPSDQEILRTVLASLKQDPRVDANGISAGVSYGAVTLDGSVPNHSQVERATQDARNIVGVELVRNHLTSVADLRNDAAIWADVKFSLETDDALSGEDIAVHVKDGVTALSGNVQSSFERERAREVASRIRGVKSVLDKLEVKAPHRSDADLANAIDQRLEANWATGEVNNNIHVAVANGVVTLSGDVDFWAERQEAGRVAFYTNGVSMVHNQLTIKGYKSGPHVGTAPGAR